MSIGEELVRHYRWLRRYGYNDSHSGNASAREGDTVWITPTGACADTLIIDELIACDIDAPGAPGASLDTPLHLEVYRRNPQARAVLHSHAPHSVALTLNGKDFVPVDFEGQLYFPKVPVVTIAYADYLRESPRRVAALLASHPVAIVRGHGVYACGASLNLAYKWMCSLEQSAKTAFIARQAGTLDEAVEALLTRSRQE
ncbi:MAG: class II aldolase/adducin family protein [Gammaproteobacteria bacterium]|nr:class II aldolase/adducin family protein [Gammaproteobacteria bacterium]MBA3730928.1 class II aldolase/adducin family protein [Gammaproteobacteria bacterium]